MLTLCAYSFHSHPRRDSRPYIRANIDTFQVPPKKEFFLKQSNPHAGTLTHARALSVDGFRIQRLDPVRPDTRSNEHLSRTILNGERFRRPSTSNLNRDIGREFKTTLNPAFPAGSDFTSVKNNGAMTWSQLGNLKTGPTSRDTMRNGRTFGTQESKAFDNLRNLMGTTM